MSWNPIAFFYKNKPDNHGSVYRFFFLVLAISCFGAACSGSKPIARKVVQTPQVQQVEETTTTQAGSDEAFMEAVKEKIMGNTSRSFYFFQNYAKYNPSNATVHYELARIWLERNQVPNALKEIKLAYRIDSTNKWIHSLYADLLAYDGQYIQAANEFSRLARKEWRNPEDYLVREAMLYQKAEKYDAAIRVLDTLSRYIGEDDEVLLLQKHQLYLQQNDVEGAAGEIKKLMAFYPSTLQYPLMLGNLYLNNNEREKAAHIFKALDAENPQNLEVQYGLMQYYIGIKDTVNLNHVIMRTLSNKQMEMADRIDLLVPFLQKGNANSEERAFGKKLAYMLAHEEPPHPAALMLYGDLLTVERQSDSALMYYKQVTEMDTTIYVAWQQILLNFAAGMKMDSVAHYSEKAILYFPKEPTAYYFAGIAFNQLMQPEKAVPVLRQAATLQKDDNLPLKSEILSTLGDAYNAMREFEAADSSYEAALKLMPDNATALNNYSYYLSLRGERLEEAANMSRRSLKVRPDEPTFLDTYGWILFKQSKFKEAKTTIEKAITLSGNDVDGTLYEHLGDIEFKLGNKEAAVEAWKKAVEKGGVSEIISKKIRDKQWYE